MGRDLIFDFLLFFDFSFFVFRGGYSTFWTLQSTFRGRRRALWACGSAELVAGAGLFVGLGVQILWQAQDFLWALKCRFRGRCSTLWPLECRCSRRAQDFVDLEVQISWKM